MGLAHNHTKITPKPTTKTQTIEPTKATGFPTQTTKSEKTTKEEKSIAPKDVGTVRAGSYCSTPGATGRTSAGTLLTCKKASDGKYRWKS
jgi:hypothetical protein